MIAMVIFYHLSSKAVTFVWGVFYTSVFYDEYIYLHHIHVNEQLAFPVFTCCMKTQFLRRSMPTYLQKSESSVSLHTHCCCLFCLCACCKSFKKKKVSTHPSFLVFWSYSFFSSSSSSLSLPPPSPPPSPLPPMPFFLLDNVFITMLPQPSSFEQSHRQTQSLFSLQSKAVKIAVDCFFLKWVKDELYVFLKLKGLMW